MANFTNEKAESKDKIYACGNCGFVDARNIVHKRVDIKEEYHYTPPYPSTTLERRGVNILQVCKECGNRTLLGFKSDCKVGCCNTKEHPCNYGGGELPEKYGCKLCPICKNTLSYGKIDL